MKYTGLSNANLTASCGSSRVVLFLGTSGQRPDPVGALPRAAAAHPRVAHTDFFGVGTNTHRFT